MNVLVDKSENIITNKHIFVLFQMDLCYLFILIMAFQVIYGSDKNKSFNITNAISNAMVLLNNWFQPTESYSEEKLSLRAQPTTHNSIKTSSRKNVPDKEEDNNNINTSTEITSSSPSTTEATSTTTPTPSTEVTQTVSTSTTPSTSSPHPTTIPTISVSVYPIPLFSPAKACHYPYCTQQYQYYNWPR